MKNYYEILQINKNASPEIIKVAYKLLVKKNHPDLKEGEEKQIAEEKIKEINEAYDVLSDPSKKAEYDTTLVNDSITQEQYNLILNENMNLKKELNYFHNLYNRNINYNRPYQNMYNNNTVKNTYSNAYTNNSHINTNSNTYEKKSHLEPKEKLKTLIAIILTFLILYILFKIPFINDFINIILGNSYL